MIRYERRGPAALVTIDRPERHNAIDGTTATALLEAFNRFVDDDADVLVLTGAGGRAFCAGADLKALETLDADAPGGPLGFTRLASPKPTIAAISGHCLAGGLELALWCDLRIASVDATFGCSERRWGVPLIDGGTQRLPRVIGTGRALDLILTGRTIDAHEALSDRPDHARSPTIPWQPRSSAPPRSPPSPRTRCAATAARCSKARGSR